MALVALLLGLLVPAPLAHATPNTWATRTPMFTARGGIGVAAAANGKLYAVGGFSGSGRGTVEEYDPASNTWTNCGTPAPANACTSMPTARFSLSVAASFNGKLYAIGGDSGTGIVATVEEFNPAANAWTSQFPMNVARRGLGAATAPFSGKLYAIGGVNGTTYFPFVEEFLPPGGAAPPTPTPSPTATPTRTPTKTATPGPPTATPFPRPNVGVQVAPGGGTLQTTITARDAGCPGGNNQLQALQFTRLTNATVDLGTSPVTTVSTAPQTVALPSHPASSSLMVHRVTPGQVATVELTVTDRCGTWPTFVGGGPSAF